MSLTIYSKRTGVPEGVTVLQASDAIFNGVTLLSDCEFTHEVLDVVDKAKYNSETTFIGRTSRFGALSTQCLSTGAKTLLNIYYHPDLCFDVVGCGDNALRLLQKLDRGFVFWKYPVLNVLGDGSCDIIYRGKHYDNIRKILVIERG